MIIISSLLSPSRSDDDSALNNLYNERFPKAKLQMEERLQVCILAVIITSHGVHRIYL